MMNLVNKLVGAIPVVILLSGAIQIIFQLVRKAIASAKDEKYDAPSVKEVAIGMVIEIVVFEGLVAVAFFVMGEDGGVGDLFIKIFQSLVGLVEESL